MVAVYATVVMLLQCLFDVDCSPHQTARVVGGDCICNGCDIAAVLV